MWDELVLTKTMYPFRYLFDHNLSLLLSGGETKDDLILLFNAFLS